MKLPAVSRVFGGLFAFLAEAANFGLLSPATRHTYTLGDEWLRLMFSYFGCTQRDFIILFVAV